MDTNETCHSVRIIRGGVLSGLSEKTSVDICTSGGWYVCNRRQKTSLKDFTQYKSQTLEERQTIQNQIFHAASAATSFF